MLRRKKKAVSSDPYAGVENSPAYRELIRFMRASERSFHETPHLVLVPLRGDEPSLDRQGLLYPSAPVPAVKTGKVAGAAFSGSSLYEEPAYPVGQVYTFENRSDADAYVLQVGRGASVRRLP